MSTQSWLAAMFGLFFGATIGFNVKFNRIANALERLEVKRDIVRVEFVNSGLNTTNYGVEK